jgi:hypothetical protein
VSVTPGLEGIHQAPTSSVCSPAGERLHLAGFELLLVEVCE